MLGRRRAEREVMVQVPRIEIVVVVLSHSAHYTHLPRPPIVLVDCWIKESIHEAGTHTTPSRLFIQIICHYVSTNQCFTLASEYLYAWYLDDPARCMNIYPPLLDPPTVFHTFSVLCSPRYWRDLYGNSTRFSQANQRTISYVPDPLVVTKRRKGQQATSWWHHTVFTTMVQNRDKKSARQLFY